MILKRPHIHPYSTLYKTTVYYFYILYNVISCIYEKTCNNTIPFTFLRWINFYEFTSYHWKITVVRIYEIIRVHIGNSDNLKWTIFCKIITKIMDVRLNFKFKCLLAIIENKIRCNEHKIAKFISLRSISHRSKIKSQSS